MPPGIVPYDICIMVEQDYEILIPKSTKINDWCTRGPFALDCLGGMNLDVYQGLEDHVIGSLSFPDMHTMGKQVFISACFTDENKILIQVICEKQEKMGHVTII